MDHIDYQVRMTIGGWPRRWLCRLGGHDWHLQNPQPNFGVVHVADASELLALLDQPDRSGRFQGSGRAPEGHVAIGHGLGPGTRYGG